MKLKLYPCDIITLACEAIADEGLENTVGEVEIGFNTNDARGCPDVNCTCIAQAWYSFVLDCLAVG